MDLSSALLIYKLNSDTISREELDKKFKKLVKKYHPDKNQEHAQWCHERMTEINESYEILMEYLESHPVPKVKKKREVKDPPKHKERSHDRFFNKATTLFFEGLHIYYDYELTKRSIRQEGVWRYHYRKSVKMMQKALDEVENRYNGELDWDLFLKFGLLFLNDIQSFEPDIPLSMRGDKTYIAFNEASKNIDKAFSGYFSASPGESEHHLSPLHRASHLLILLVESYPQTEWYNLSLQKLNLLDSFLDLQELIKKGIITY